MNKKYDYLTEKTVASMAMPHNNSPADAVIDALAQSAVLAAGVAAKEEKVNKDVIAHIDDANPFV